ncbi:GNAT family N-acetyltransferase [Halobacterium sp. NMX12-1]|uniref:GNAT family N-acetyltransferase n=1 Tax=Halobacterium sp. NMX12-1 TaxID=3166650 RepID=A0AAU8CAR7_9EURY
MSSPSDGLLPRVTGLARRLVARFRPERITLTPPPTAFTDGEDREVRVRAYDERDFESLVGMYDDFDPSQRAQGTPPLAEDAIRDWLDGVLDGPNVVAVADGEVVGHVMFVPDGTGRHELAVFVHQDYQRAGIGTHLLAVGLEHARREGVEYVWLSVESWKRDAQRLYQRAGFSTVNPMGAAHRMSRYL